MTRMPSLGGVILAAGQSTRMGRDKALLPWPPDSTDEQDTLLSAAIKAFSEFNDLVIVVGGKNSSSLAHVVDANAAHLVVNPDPDRGQFSSLQCGLQELLNRGRDAAMITLVDRPPVRASTLETMLAEFPKALSSGKWVLVPEYKRNHGHPILIGREFIELFLKAPTTDNAGNMQRQNQTHIQYFPVDDPLIAMNVNTPKDYSNLLKLI